jgi:elongation factor P hydroxylase
MSQTVNVDVKITNMNLLKKVCKKLGYTYNASKNCIEGDSLYRPIRISKDKVIFDSMDQKQVNKILNEYAYEEVHSALFKTKGRIFRETRTEDTIVLEVEVE